MNNFDKFRQDLLSLGLSDFAVSFRNDRVYKCEERSSCKFCKFNSSWNSCDYDRLLWLQEERSC
ncbi:hypothetical protein [Microvirus mar20]|uniref:Uncharacterized protein n=1 Tax=Microvirus mar20 TaxID=2851153 RepID=A0A8F5MJ14_9VIRU|nr:hypothetical protein [Microvirus mar20]